MVTINVERRRLEELLRRVRSRPTYDELREDVHALELEHRHLSQRMTLCDGQPPYELTADERALDEQVALSIEEASRTRRVCETWWEDALLYKPEEMSEELYWVS
jgi:hypothetical protein